MVKIFLNLIVILNFSISFAQKPNKIDFKKDGQLFSYFQFLEVNKPKALLVLFDGGEGNAEGINIESQLPQAAAAQEILTIGISYTEAHVPDSTYLYIKECIMHALVKDHINKEKIYMGGFSGGGIVVTRFAEKLKQNFDKQCVPKAIFAIDSPLDYIDLYNYCIREVNRKCPNPDAKIGVDEAKWVKEEMEKKFGDPTKDVRVYQDNSPYSMSAPDGGNAKYLIDMPIRIYHEVDPMWNIKERCRTAIDSHPIVTTELINYLYQKGNHNAELVISLNRGRRSDGRRHPHSWSIVDEKECINWLMKFK